MSRARRPEELLDRPIPDLTLLDQTGAEFPVRRFVGRQPLALFCYILNGTPG
ncbi:MAG TPA: hypothetical protein VEY91_08380 [Candidatus Limnocylindria bacterium]|nr:hypothetical protein [Candidatus Limnocylindria bacterium]